MDHYLQDIIDNPPSAKALELAVLGKFLIDLLWAICGRSDESIMMHIADQCAPKVVDNVSHSCMFHEWGPSCCVLAFRGRQVT